MAFKIEAEHTDTFGGEPNYCWVRRKTLEIEDGTSDRSVMRIIKREFGMSGVRGRSYSHGDKWEFRPYRMCQVILAHVVY